MHLKVINFHKMLSVRMHTMRKLKIPVEPTSGIGFHLQYFDFVTLHLHPFTKYIIGMWYLLSESATVQPSLQKKSYFTITTNNGKLY